MYDCICMWICCLHFRIYQTENGKTIHHIQFSPMNWFHIISSAAITKDSISSSPTHSLSFHHKKKNIDYNNIFIIHSVDKNGNATDYYHHFKGFFFIYFICSLSPFSPSNLFHFCSFERSHCQCIALIFVLCVWAFQHLVTRFGDNSLCFTLFNPFSLNFLYIQFHHFSSFQLAIKFKPLNGRQFH